MAVEIPDEVRWLLPIVVGESWPEGDEDKLRELRDAWTAVAEALPDAMDTGNRAAREVLATWNGEAADKFEQTWRKFSSGDDAVFHSLGEGSRSLAEACDKAALDIEYTKYMIIASLVVLAIQIAAMVAAAFVSFGASSAGIVPAQMATRAAVQMIFKQLVEKLLQQGVKKVVREALEKVLKKGLEKVVSKAALRSLGNHVAANMVIQGGMDVGIQGIQMAKGDRQSWDWDKTEQAAAGGAAGGVAGHLVNGNAAGKAAADAVSGGGSSVLGHAARGAAEGVLGTVGQAAATGQLGDMKASDLALGASSGAVDGGSGGAKEGFHDAAKAHTAADSANVAAHNADSAAHSAASAAGAGEQARSISADVAESVSPSSAGGVESAATSQVSSGSESVPEHPAATSSAGAVAPERPQTAAPGVMGAQPPSGTLAQPGNSAGPGHGGPHPGNYGMVGGPAGQGGAPQFGPAPRGEFGARPSGFGPSPEVRGSQGGGQPSSPHQGPVQRGFAPQNTPRDQGVVPRFGPQSQSANSGPIQQGGPAPHAQAQPHNRAQPGPVEPRQTAPANLPPTGYPPAPGPNPLHRSPQQGTPQHNMPQTGTTPDPRMGWQQGGQPPRGPMNPNGGPPPRQAPTTHGRPQSPDALRQQGPERGRPIGTQNPPARDAVAARENSVPREPARPENPARHDNARPANPEHHSDRPVEHPQPRHEPAAESPRQHNAAPDQHQRSAVHDQHAPEDGHSTPELDGAAHRDGHGATPFDHADTQETWKPSLAKAAEETGTKFSRDQTLDFARDPNYRAPDAAFDALDRHLSGIGDYQTPTRRAELASELNERFQQSPELQSVSKQGALAVRAYTGHEIFGEINTASRFGMMTENQRHMLQAVVSGMNESPLYQGPMSRSVDFGGNKLAADFAVGHYEPGKVTVETQIVSGTMTDGAKAKSDFPGDVRLHIDSKTARRIDGLSGNPGEREAGLKPMSQLYVHDKKLVTWEPTHSRDPGFRWEIHAEEVVPGDPRYLPAEEASRQVAERQLRTFGEQLVVDAGPTELQRRLGFEEWPPHSDERAEQHGSGKSIEHQLDPEGHDRAAHEAQEAAKAAEPKKSFSDILHPHGEPDTGALDDTPDAEKHGRITGLLAPDDVPQPGEIPPGHHELPQPGHDSVPPMPVNEDGTPDWRVLARPTPPATSLPALHYGTGHVRHGDAYVATHHPELMKVNPNFYRSDAFETGWQTNCTRCVVNYAKRLMGIEEPVEPVLPEDLSKADRMGWMAEQLGSRWEPMPPNYDHVIQRMSQEPIGSHASVYVAYPNGSVDSQGRMGLSAHVAVVTNTPHGVAFLDPQTGHLMSLPYPPHQLQLLPFGGKDTGTVNLEAGADPSKAQNSVTANEIRNAERTTPNIPAPQDVSARHKENSAALQDDSVRHDSMTGEADSARGGRSPVDPHNGEPREHGWRQDGPWWGQHVNPFHPQPMDEDDYQLGPMPHPGNVPLVEPAGSSQPAPAPPQEAPPPASSAPEREGMASGTPGPGAGTNGPTSDASGMPSTPGGLNHSLSGDLGIAEHANPQVDSSGTTESAGVAPAGPAGTDPMGSPAVGDPARAAGADHASATSAALTLDPPRLQQAQSVAPSAGGGQMAGVPPMGAPAAAGAEAAGPKGRARELGSVTHHRDVPIPADVAKLYLANHEPTTILPADGRQVLFRPTAAFGGAAREAADPVDATPHLRYETLDAASMGSHQDMPEDEFAGRAEIYLRGDDGSDVVLGSFDAGQWTPTPEGHRWLADTHPSGNEWGRTR